MAADKLNTYTQTLYHALRDEAPDIVYTPRSEAQLRDNLEASYKAGYDQSVASRQQAARQNRAAIDADAASRGMGASTWVTDAKNRQTDNLNRDLTTLAANRNATIAQQLAAALADQEANKLAVDQFNAQQRAGLLSSALSTSASMYDRWENEEKAGRRGGRSRASAGGVWPDMDEEARAITSSALSGASNANARANARSTAATATVERQKQLAQAAAKSGNAEMAKYYSHWRPAR